MSGHRARRRNGYRLRLPDPDPPALNHSVVTGTLLDDPRRGRNPNRRAGHAAADGGRGAPRAGDPRQKVPETMSRPIPSRELPYAARARIADNVFLLRKRAGYSQEDLSKLAMISADRSLTLDTGTELLLEIRTRGGSA
jgi:hypothetical protein